MPVGHIATARGLSNAAEQTNELCKHRARAPLLLAEKLRRGQSVINRRSSFKYRDLLHDGSNGKV